MRPFAKGELKKFEKAIKLIYSSYSDIYCIYQLIQVSEDKIIRNVIKPTQCLTQDDIENYSNFILPLDYLPIELGNCLINIPNVIEGIKGKAKEIFINGDKVYLTGGTFDGLIEIAVKWIGEHEVRNIHQDEGLKLQISKTFGSDIIQRLIDNERVTLRPDIPDTDIGLMVTKKFFPNIKKVSEFTVTWYYDEDIDFTMVNIQVSLDDTGIQMLYVNNCYCLKC